MKLAITLKTDVHNPHHIIADILNDAGYITYDKDELTLILHVDELLKEMIVRQAGEQPSTSLSPSTQPTHSTTNHELN